MLCLIRSIVSRLIQDALFLSVKAGFVGHLLLFPDWIGQTKSKLVAYHQVGLSNK